MRLNEISVADNPESWTALGFTVVNGYVSIGRSLRFKLSGAGAGEGKGGGVLDYTFGDAGRSQAESLDINGLTTTIEGLPNFLDDPTIQHANSVVGCMKTVILANNADETSKQLQAHMPELGKPALSDTSDTGIRYDYWTHLDDTDFEVVSMQEEVARDTIGVTFLFVDDLDVAIAAFGAQNVSEKSVYSQRDRVQVQPSCGITANLSLISQSVRETG